MLTFYRTFDKLLEVKMGRKKSSRSARLQDKLRKQKQRQEVNCLLLHVKNNSYGENVHATTFSEWLPSTTI